MLAILCMYPESPSVPCCMQYNAINGWILGNSNGKYQTTYNGTLNAVGTAITKQPTLFGTDLQCASVPTPTRLGYDQMPRATGGMIIPAPASEQPKPACR